jgi:adenylyltransferase/sulfurtransferase
VDDPLVSRRVLVVGVGGLGCPCLLALIRAGARRVTLLDEDEVELHNLHRQILYRDQDVGQDKLKAAGRAALEQGMDASGLELVRGRLLPENAREFVARADVVVEGADNFATKFLTADACMLERRPVVHGAAVRWQATVLAAAPTGAPCYRCLFEDLPEVAPNCAEAGVVGPMLGIAGALMAEAAVRILRADDPPFGTIYTVDGRRDRVRQIAVPPRHDCALCGTQAQISGIDRERYLAPSCAL